MLQTLSDDDTASDAVLKDLLEQTKIETGVKKELTGEISSIIDCCGKFREK